MAPREPAYDDDPELDADSGFYEDAHMAGGPLDPTEKDHASVDSRPPVVRTEGQRLLIAAPGTNELIAEAIGATKQAVHLWRHGSRTPGPQWRRALHEQIGIPPGAWARTPLPPGTVTAPAPRFDDDDDGDDDDEPSALDDAARLLRMLRRQMSQPGLLAREHAQLSASFARALAQKERMERDHALLEDRTIREHPKWKRLKAAMIAALVDYPDAARAVEAVVRRELGDEEP